LASRVLGKLDTPIALSVLVLVCPCAISRNVRGNVCCVVLDSVCDLLVDGVRVGECCVETTATNAEEFTVVQVVVAVCGSTS
jgi:hypothetical protein